MGDFGKRIAWDEKKEIPKEETYNKYGDAARRIEIASIEKHGTFAQIPFEQIPNGVSLIEGGFVYAIKTNPFRRDMRKPTLISMKTENLARGFA